MNKSFEDDVFYFVELVFNNIQSAKTKKNKRKEVFSNLKIKSDSKIVVRNKKMNYSFMIQAEQLKTFSFKHYLTQYLALFYINSLIKYAKNEMTFEELADIKKEVPNVVKDIIKQKNNISEQLILLRRNRNIAEVQQYIDDLYNYEYATAYTKYLIDRYYYDIKGLIKPEKNCLERMFKLLLR